MDKKKIIDEFILEVEKVATEDCLTEANSPTPTWRDFTYEAMISIRSKMDLKGDQD